MEKLSRAPPKFWWLLKIIILFLSFLPFFVYAAHPLNIINEIAWMGTEKGWQYEWIELYNPNQKEIEIRGWKIENASSKGKSLEICSGNILPQSYFLICKKEVENCDFKSWALSLNNNYQENGKLVLKDREGNIIDQTPEPVDSNWPAGYNETKQTMERKIEIKPGSDLENWESSQNSGGTPKAKNSVAIKIEKPSQSKPQPELKKPIPSGVIINEVLPDPQGISDKKGEYIEIFNQNNFEVDLSNWQIIDVMGKVRCYHFPQETKISSQGFLVLSRATTNITLNNGGDGLNVIQSNGKIIDGINYGKAIKGQSYNLTEEGWVWSSILTPGSANIISPQKTEKAKCLEKPKKIDINKAVLKDLAKIIYIEKARAKQLISLRPFYSLNELTNIKGINQKILEDIKKQGLAWVDPELEPPQKKEKTKSLEKGAAALKEPFKKSYSHWPLSKSLPVPLIASALAIFSGIIILILKKKIEKYNKII